MDEKEIEEQEPLEVTVKEKPKPPSPSFDYDDYSPTDEEILEIEMEITEKIKKDTKNG